MVAPDSASFRCLNALRYFVRSYVTNPTTIKAITDMPAKTPRPMGRTESVLPGNWNAADAEAVESGAEVPALCALVLVGVVALVAVDVDPFSSANADPDGVGVFTLCVTTPDALCAVDVAVDVGALTEVDVGAFAEDIAIVDVAVTTTDDVAAVAGPELGIVVASPLAVAGPGLTTVLASPLAVAEPGLTTVVVSPLALSGAL